MHWSFYLILRRLKQPMNGTSSLLQELEEAISQGSDQSRLRALWHATDVLVAGQYSEQTIWVFGEIIERLTRELEVEVRAQLSQRLADSNNAPIDLINRLANHKSIDVAGAVLQRSERLDTPALVSIATTGSQQHLLAISKRRTIAEPVTDVLVTRGNREVLNSLTRNPGARFSHNGFLQLIQRTKNDSVVIETLGLRKDIPRSIFQQLIAKASADLKRKLESERPDMADRIETLVTDVTGDLHAIFGPASQNYFEAKKAVSTLHRYGNLHEKKIFEYAQSHQSAEVTAGLSLLCSLPPNIVERGLADSTGEMPMIFAKSLGFSWETTMSLLFLGAQDRKILAHDLDALEQRFSRLGSETAQSVIRLYQSRKASARAVAQPATGM
jgi:Uncharacterised protein conserved in bacteria (DUF2336)